MVGKIIGTGSYFPDNIIRNDDLTKYVDTSDEWISSRTGIRERRIVKDETTSEMAINAAEKALENSNVKPEDIELIIVATMSGDHIMPNTACVVQSKIGATNAACFDMNVACSGFVYAISTANAFISSGLYKKVLVIGADSASRLLDWTDRATCVLFGDGAGAVVMEASEKGCIHTIMGADGARSNALYCDGNRMNSAPWQEESNKSDNPESSVYVKMDGQEVFKFVVKTIPEYIERALKESNVKKDEIKYFILHQANKRILQSVAKKLGVEEENFPMNLERYGNTSSASIPVLLDEMNRAGKFKEGDKIVMAGFGAGLTWGALIIEW